MRTETILLHDWLTGFRGGERVLEAFCELYPEAPIYSLLHVKGSTSPTIEKHQVHTSFLNSWPGAEKNYRKFLPFMPLAADQLKIRESAEVVLSSSHCVIKGVKKPAESVHVSYVHSPMRYMYDQYDHYFGPHASLANRLGARLCRNYLVNWDRASNKNVDLMIANSRFVQARIRKYYGIDSEVVHPFVDLKDFAEVATNPRQKQDQYVMVTAFAPNKRVDLAIAAFNEMKKPLVIIGGGQLDEELRAMAGPTIQFLGNVDRATVVETLAKSRALIFPGVEDFGITPLEALAAGTPVVALKVGGVLETLTEGDSVFFDELTVKSLTDAVRKFESLELQPDFARLKAFSKERFKAEITGWVEEAKNRRSRK